MKAFTCICRGQECLAATLEKQSSDAVIPALDGDWDGPRDMLGLVDLEPSEREKFWGVVHRYFEDGRFIVPINDMTFCAPIPRPRQNILCLGWNYVDHIDETGKTNGRGGNIPKHPVVFTKDVSCVIGAYANIPYDESVIRALDWEAELALVIGKKAYQVPVDRALEYVFGYTVVNDITERGLQKRHSQFFLGKSLPGSCPIGPWIVTADEIPDPQTLHVKSWVSGELMQDSSTAKQIFSVAEVIARISFSMPLYPGTVIATGTPAGVGYSRIPPRFLKPGDLVECEVGSVGKLKNWVQGIKKKSVS